jgi:hypothetical protein
MNNKKDDFHYVIARLKTAEKQDFSHSDGSKRLNVPYFCKGANGEMQSKMYFFSDDTDINDFKILYSNNQVFVFSDPTEPVHNFNCIDWDFILNEINNEHKQLNHITP